MATGMRVDLDVLLQAVELNDVSLRAFIGSLAGVNHERAVEQYLMLLFTYYKRCGDLEALNAAAQRSTQWVLEAPAEHEQLQHRIGIMDQFSSYVRFCNSGQVTFDPLSGTLGLGRDSAIDRRLIAGNALMNSGFNKFMAWRKDQPAKALIESLGEVRRGMDTQGFLRSPAFDVTYAGMLSEAFHATSDVDYLQEAVLCAAEAAVTMHEKHPARPCGLSALAALLNLYSVQTNVIATDILNSSISILHGLRMSGKIYELKTDYWTDPGRALSTLGSALGQRFEKTHSIDDLNYAILVLEEAGNYKTPGDDQTYNFTTLSALSSCLYLRYERTGSQQDLNRSIEALEVILASLSEDRGSFKMDVNTERLALAANLSTYLLERYELHHKPEDFSRGLDVSQEASRDLRETHPNKARALNGYATWMGHQFDRTGSLEHLHMALEYTRLAIRASDPTTPDHSRWSLQLARLLGKRRLQTESRVEEDEELNCLLETWQNCQDTQGLPSIRIQSARFAAMILISRPSDEDRSRAAALMEDAVMCLQKMSPRSWHHSDKQDIITAHSNLASQAASVFLTAGKLPYEALRVLDFGRGSIGGVLLDLRQDLSTLKTVRPQLAEKLQHIFRELDFLVSSVTGDKSPNRRVQLERDLEATVEEVRTTEGFESFLSLLSDNAIRETANRGPVIVINVSILRCDALLVETTGIRSLHLPDVTLSDIEEFIPALDDPWGIFAALEWLWHSICKPCLDALGFANGKDDDELPHVWWVPVGIVSLLPLHAAGMHLQDSTDSVMDRVVSSYATSVKALRDQRALAARYSSDIPRQALLIDMAATQDYAGGNLAFANREVEALRDICRSMSLEPITLPHPRLKKDVIASLPRCDIFHFAGHGRSVAQDPSDSYIMLDDWKADKLTVGNVRDLRLFDQPPFLAYLSACETTKSKQHRLLDESLHLTSAFQLAGFCHVIGTLWTVDDEHCVKVSKVVYETLQREGRTDEAVRKGLHKSLRALRDEAVNARKSANNKVEEQSESLGSQMASLSLALTSDGRGAGQAGRIDKTSPESLINESEPLARVAGVERPESHGKRTQILLEDDSTDSEEDAVDAVTSTLWVPFVHFGA
ncbi:hypothetical protein NLU13_8339 [Sarocladium strictum]|uniref:CHAT domain-containing protein n=1 Tax=Sarocladium strictum TaxID=5046 RepID=A0AA39GBY9_SARSR|nr:hypothetical protein NLU13_8339 [Sarocladium strictum]